VARRKIRWAPLALKDLHEVKEYIQRDKPSAAREEAKRIRKSTERLARFPESGRTLETIPRVREIVAGNYRVFYMIEPSHVVILRVYHGRRNIPFIP
jgi:toxin ParE1/3/4